MGETSPHTSSGQLISRTAQRLQLAVVKKISSKTNFSFGILPNGFYFPPIDSTYIQFAEPNWFIALAAIPLIIVVAVIAARKQSKAWLSLVAPRLRDRLVKRRPPFMKWLAFTLALCGFALLCLTMARPFHGHEEVTSTTRSRNIMISIDTSRSMLVEDVSPNRLEAAKAIALELLAASPQDRVGVMVYAGESMIIAPLTIDHNAVRETISQLDTDYIPMGGSNMDRMVEMAMDSFKKSGHSRNALVIIGDGEDYSENIDSTIKQIRESSHLICSVAVGTERGGIIPDPRQRDGKFRDFRGQTVLSKMEVSPLNELAAASGGPFMGATADTVKQITQAISAIDAEEEKDRVRTIPLERYQWALLPAVILLFLSVLATMSFARRGQPDAPAQPARKANKKPILSALAIAGITLAATSQPAHAAGKVVAAKAALEKQDYQLALSLLAEANDLGNAERRAQIDFAEGTAHYKLGDLRSAADSFSRSLLSQNNQLQSESYYNLGNTLFLQGWQRIGVKDLSKPAEAFTEFVTKDAKDNKGEGTKELIGLWESALQQYQQSSQLNASHSAAATNAKEVEKWLQLLKNTKVQEEMENPQDQQDQDQQDQDQQNQDQQNQDQQNQDQQNQDQQNQDQQNQDQQNQDQQNQDQQNQDQQNQDQQNQDQQNQDQQNQDQQNQDQQEGQEGDQQEDQEGQQQDGQQQEGQEGQQQNQQGQEQQGEGQEGQQQDGQQGMEARQLSEQEMEAAREHARQILEANSDLETKPIRRRNRWQRQPKQDW